MKTISQQRFARLLNTASRSRDIPVHGYFELTPLCNLDCRMCYVHRKDAEVKKRMLSGDEWITLIDEAIAHGMITALLTGGEALTHPDFWKIYLHLFDQGIPVSLKTNGLLLNEQTLERLIEYPPASIDISLYGCDDDSYEAVTGHRVFSIIEKNISALKQSGIGFRIMITPSRFMMPRLNDTLLYASKLGEKVVVNTMLFEADDEVGNKYEDFNLTVDEEIQISYLAGQIIPPEVVSVSEEEQPEYNQAVNAPVSEEGGLKCYAGRTTFSITWDGCMTPCLTYPRELVCAHPLTDGFDSAWRKVNDHVKSFVPPIECEQCEIRERCHYCPGLHGKHSAQNKLCNPSVCAYYKHFALNNNNKEGS